MVVADASALSGMLQSFNAITNIGKALLGLRDSAMINQKVVELNKEILTAQASALAIQTEQFALLEQKRALEKEIADLKAWEAEKQKYELINIRDQVTTNHFGPAFARALKKEASSSEPFHLICPDCYERSEKSIMQEEGRPGRIQVVFCQRCQFEISRTGLWELDTSRWATPKKRK